MQGVGYDRLKAQCFKVVFPTFQSNQMIQASGSDAPVTTHVKSTPTRNNAVADLKLTFGEVRDNSVRFR